MKYISSSSETDRLWNNIVEGKAYAVSNGSYFPTTSTCACAWIVATLDGTQWIKGGGLIPGNECDQDPYRSELGGQLGLAAVISAIVLPPNITPHITVACDGKAALGQVELDANKTKTKMNCVDLISIISELWSTSRFKISKEHVYGHKDDLHRQLTQMEALNCRVDTYAKEIAGYRMEKLIPKQLFKPTDLGIGTITCSNILITSKVQQSLYKMITHKTLIQAMSKDQEVDADLTRINIDWQAFSKARKESSKKLQLFITKCLSGNTATGRVMVKGSNAYHPNVPAANMKINIYSIS